MNWQPIETAPRDGSRILLYVPCYGAMSGNWSETLSPMTDDSRWHCHATINREAQPTKWMPLPAPPNDRKSDALAIPAIAEMREALGDALSGWRYIRLHYGDLDGVGWDRVETSGSAALDAVEKGGVRMARNFPEPQRSHDYKDRAIKQTFSWAMGQPYHEKENDECCPDFSCCYPALFIEDAERRWRIYWDECARIKGEK